MELKKNPAYELESKRPLFLSIGLVIALLFVTIAFNWKSEYEKVTIRQTKDVFEPYPTVYITNIEPPKPVEKKAKPIKQKEFVRATVSITEEIEELIDVIDKIDQPSLNDIPLHDMPVEVIDNEIHDFVESMPEFPGGMDAFYSLISKEITYPRQAQRMNIQGKVFVRFVIDKDGSITDVETVKGIGAGCDKEAERVIRGLPNFTPGKQRGRPVKVKMILPIMFKFSN